MAKERVDDSKPLDVWRLQRDGWLHPGCGGALSWHRGDNPEPTGSISVAATEAALHVSYTVTRRWDNGTRDYAYAVPLLDAAGRRWFGCPSCGRRCQKLYLPPSGGIFACRRCHDLAYETQQERTSRGLWAYRKLEKVEKELYTLPPTASGRKFGRLYHEVQRLRDITEASFQAFLAPHNRFLESRGLPRVDDSPLRPAPDAIPAPKLPRGRPKEKRAYTRQAPRPELSPPGADRAYCVKCRDRRRLLWARRVTLASVRPALRGRCAECRTRLCRILPADAA